MTDFEYLERIGQMSIFDVEDSPAADPAEASKEIEIGSLVKIDISGSDEQTVNYFRYYYPHVINKSGIVRGEKYIAAGYMLYQVEVLGELHWMHEDEVEILE